MNLERVDLNLLIYLDVDGQYKGTLPCADCEGIETTLTLHADKSYEISEKYLGGKAGDKPLISKGKFTFSANGNTITLDKADNERKYFVGENQLFALDTAGKKITGPMADLYILKKQVN